MLADVAIIKGWKADEAGNLVFRKTARNFNYPMATAAKICVAEVEEVVPAGSLDPDCIHLPGIYVKRMIIGSPYEQKIEFMTTRQREAAYCTKQRKVGPATSWRSGRQGNVRAAFTSIWAWEFPHWCTHTFP